MKSEITFAVFLHTEWLTDSTDCTVSNLAEIMTNAIYQMPENHHSCIRGIWGCLLDDVDSKLFIFIFKTLHGLAQ